jgi:integrase
MATIAERRNRNGELIGWQAKIRRNGWPTLSKTSSSRREVEEWAKLKEAEMIKGDFIDKRPADRITFGDAIDRFVEDIAPIHKGGRSEIYRLNQFKRDEAALCQYSMARLTPELFEEFRDRRLAQVSAGTVRREMNLLHSVIETWRRKNRLIENPLKDTRRPSVGDERDVRLNPNEWARLLKECLASRNPWLAPAIELLRETGARRSELLKWKWSDTDLSANVATFRDVKNSHDAGRVIDRCIGLSPRAIEILTALPRDSNEDRIIPLTIEALKQAFERARKRAKLSHFRMHDIRHELASSLHERGWSPVEVMAQGGWRDPKSMKRYSNLSAQHLATRFRKLEITN